MKYITNTIVALANVGAIVWLMYCDYPIMNTLVIIGIAIVDMIWYDTAEKDIIG